MSEITLTGRVANYNDQHPVPIRVKLSGAQAAVSEITPSSINGCVYSVTLVNVGVLTSGSTTIKMAIGGVDTTWEWVIDDTVTDQTVVYWEGNVKFELKRGDVIDLYSTGTGVSTGFDVIAVIWLYATEITA